MSRGLAQAMQVEQNARAAAERECEQLRALLRQVQLELGVVRENEAICVDRALDLIDESGLLDGGQQQ